MSPLRFAHQIAAIAVRKREVADQRVEPAILQKFESALRRISGSDFVPALAQNP